MVKVLYHHEGNRSLSQLYTGMELSTFACWHHVRKLHLPTLFISLRLRLFLFSVRTGTLTLDIQPNTGFSHYSKWVWQTIAEIYWTVFKLSGKEALHRRKRKPAIILNSFKGMHNASICKIPTHLSKVWSAFLFNSSWVPFTVAVGEDTMPFESWIQCFRLNK